MGIQIMKISNVVIVVLKQGTPEIPGQNEQSEPMLAGVQQPMGLFVTPSSATTLG